jgi:hypothetical protein
MASTTLLSVSLLSLALLLTGCTKSSGDYGFQISNVSVSTGHQKIHARYSQNLKLSRDAIAALENGVPLTLSLDMELRDAFTLTLLADDSRHYGIRFLPLNQVYELSFPDGSETRNFPRLRHVMAEMANLNIDFRTGPLAPGSYEYRARIRLDNSSLPAPMHLPALFSSEWKHDSGWSTWPFEINA